MRTDAKLIKRDNKYYAEFYAEWDQMNQDIPDPDDTDGDAQPGGGG